VRRARTGLALWALPLFALAAPQDPVIADTAGAHPLLELAREREKDRDRSEHGASDGSEVREALHRLEQAQVPGDAECAASIGAARYVDLHLLLANAYFDAGEFPAAAAAYRHALACKPHAPEVLAALAGTLFNLRDYAATREVINRSLAMDPRSVEANRRAANLDFVQEHWADAIARFRYIASSDTDRVRAGYGQLMYWLSQRRAGIAKPEFIVRTPGEGWPQPLLLYMRGEYTEQELVEPILAGDDPGNVQVETSTDERLCEALFYVGEDYWARGRPDVARDYFTALVNIKVIDFLEHSLALAEIAKLRD
jgi:lipoprotein NlpI